MDKFIKFFQICHSTEQPVCKEADEKREYKEANQEKDAANRKHATAHCKNSSSNNHLTPSAIVRKIGSIIVQEQWIWPAVAILRMS